MRILHLNDQPDYTGGINTYLREVMQAQAELGHEVELFSPLLGGRDRFLEPGSFSRWLSITYYSEVLQLVRSFQPDLLHAHSLSLRLSPLPLRAGLVCRIPVVMTVHDFNYLCPRKWFIYKNNQPCIHGWSLRCLISNCRSGKEGYRYLPYHALRWLKVGLHRYLLKRWVTLFVCPSTALQRNMARFWPSIESIYLPNFISRSGTEPIPNDKILLFVGRLSKEKGLEDLLTAMPGILGSHPEAILLVAGAGPEEGLLRRRASTIGIRDSLSFLGEIDTAELPRLYRKASICVLPSLWMENCPMVALESLSHGRPIVAYDRGGIPDLVQNGRTGVLVTPGNVDELAGQISRLLSDQELLSEMGRRAGLLFRERFAKQLHLDALNSIYAQALGRVKSARPEQHVLREI